MPIFTLTRFIRGFLRGWQDHEFRILFFLVMIILISGTFFYHRIENWTWLNSLYFSVITLTTVGYGDFYPHTDAGKIFTIIYIFAGIGVILAFITSVARHASTQMPLAWKNRDKK